jgi:hypothetical protein
MTREGQGHGIARAKSLHLAVDFKAQNGLRAAEVSALDDAAIL